MLLTRSGHSRSGAEFIPASGSGRTWKGHKPCLAGLCPEMPPLQRPFWLALVVGFKTGTLPQLILAALLCFLLSYGAQTSLRRDALY
ncbi:MAG: hypothetical protein JXA96_01135 [Sedimentisphaerales bacterium]|nr:hypothetical protein [Sedimentisphaerales bacterium]